MSAAANMLDPARVARDEITAARVKLLLTKPFFGTLASTLIAVDATSWTKTLATDGKHLFYNRFFVVGLTRAELMFGIVHEVLHVIFDHVGRRGTRDKDIWNMAIDFIVNYILVKEGIGTRIKNTLYDERFTDEMTADEVYNILIDESVEIKVPFDEHLDPAPGSESSQQDGDGDGDDDQQDDDGAEPKHAPNVKGEGTVRVLGRGGRPVISEKEMNNFRNAFRARVISAAQQHGKAGGVPMGIRRLIKKLTEPQLDWRTMLDAFTRSAFKDDYTFGKISRKSWSTGALLPAQNFMFKVKIFCAIDASGSTTQEMVTDFLSEIRGIAIAFRDFEIDVISFDTEVYNHITLTPANIDDVYHYEIRGGGGTMFEEVYAWLKRHGFEPDRLAILTDGLPNDTWGDPNYVDTIFIIHSNPHITAPFGLTAHYKPSKLKKAA